MECSNKRCPLKDDSQGSELAQYRYDSLKFIPCEKCGVTFYCSPRCAQLDWFKEHQFDCRGGTKDLQQSDVERIESSTPFIKEGFFSDMIDDFDATVNDIEMHAQITLADIEFVKSANSILGKGSYGEVELAVHKKTGKNLAIKKIDKQSLANKKIKATLMREVDIHKRLKHENIIRLYTSFEDKHFIYLVLEYAAKGNLFYMIRHKKTLTEDEAFYFFIQTCAGIYFLHKNGLIHRDIKPENLLVSKDNILKICDFGWCVQSNNEEQRSTFCGTLEYMAPEMLQNFSHNHTLDVWCLGILLYELVHGSAPFTGNNPRDIGQKIMKRSIRFNQKCTPEYKDLVDKLLQHEPANRLPLIKVFEHPWVKGFEEKYNLRKSAEEQSFDEECKASLNSSRALNQSVQSNRSQKNLFSKKNNKEEVKQNAIRTGAQSKLIDMSDKKSVSNKQAPALNPHQPEMQPVNLLKKNNDIFKENAIMLSDDDEDDVMRELEDFVKPKKKKKHNKKKDSDSEEEEDVYDMCDQMLEDLNYLDAQLQKRESRATNQKQSVRESQANQKPKVEEKKDWLNQQYEEIVHKQPNKMMDFDSDMQQDYSYDSKFQAKKSIQKSSYKQQSSDEEEQSSPTNITQSFQQNNSKKQFEQSQAAIVKQESFHKSNNSSQEEYQQEYLPKNSIKSSISQNPSLKKKQSDEEQMQRVSQQKKMIAEPQWPDLQKKKSDKEERQSNYNNQAVVNQDYNFEEGLTLNSVDVSDIQGSSQKDEKRKKEYDEKVADKFKQNIEPEKPAPKSSVYDKYPLKNSYSKQQQQQQEDQDKMQQQSNDYYNELKFSQVSTGSFAQQKQVFSAKPFNQSNAENLSFQQEEKYQKKAYDEVPKIQLRDTDKQVDFEQLRKDQLKNLDNLWENMEHVEIGIDEQKIKNEVKEYAKASKNYKKQYKENVKNVIQEGKRKNDDSDYEQTAEEDGKKQGSSNKKDKNKNDKKDDKDEYGDLWNCQRINDNKQHLKNIPIDEKGQQQWLDSRKMDMHLDLDFLPRHLVYNYGDFAESNHLMEQVLEDMKDFQLDETQKSMTQQFLRESEQSYHQQYSKKSEVSQSNNKKKQQAPTVKKQENPKKQQQSQRESEMSEMRMSKNIFNKMRGTNEMSIRMSQQYNNNQQQQDEQSEEEEEEDQQQEQQEEDEEEEKDYDDEYEHQAKQSQHKSKKSNHRQKYQDESDEERDNDYDEEDEEDENESYRLKLEKQEEEERQKRINLEQVKKLKQQIIFQQKKQKEEENMGSTLFNGITSLFSLGCANNKK